MKSSYRPIIEISTCVATKGRGPSRAAQFHAFVGLLRKDGAMGIWENLKGSVWPSPIHFHQCSQLQVDYLGNRDHEKRMAGSLKSFWILYDIVLAWRVSGCMNVAIVFKGVCILGKDSNDLIR